VDPSSWTIHQQYRGDNQLIPLLGSFVRSFVRSYHDNNGA
jgi:hypothetical protein